MDAHEPTTWLWREELCYCVSHPTLLPVRGHCSLEEEFTGSLPCLLVLPDSILLLRCSFGMNVQELLEHVPRSGLAMPGVCVPGNSPDKDILFSKEVCVVLYFLSRKGSSCSHPCPFLVLLDVPIVLCTCGFLWLACLSSRTPALAACLSSHRPSQSKCHLLRTLL